MFNISEQANENSMLNISKQAMRSVFNISEQTNVSSVLNQ